jgi:uncharacterized membrane protein YqjE
MEILKASVECELFLKRSLMKFHKKTSLMWQEEKGDVPGWVLVVLMTTGLVTGIWTLAAPKLSSLLNDSLNSMNNIR